MSSKPKDELLDDSFDVGSIDFAQIEEVSRVFQQESEEILGELDGHILRLEQAPEDQDQINLLFRKVHTIKGSVGAVPGGQLLGSLSHEFEALLNRIKLEGHFVSKQAIDIFLKSSRLMKVLASSLYEKRELYPEELSEAIELISSYGNFSFSDEAPSGPRVRSLQAASSEVSSREEGIWLPMEQLNEFLKLSGELLVLKNFFGMLSQTVDLKDNPELYQKRQNEFSQGLGKISDQLQAGLQGIRKEKVSACLQGLPILIRQASTELNKPVQFHFEGAEVLIDKSLGHDLQECLVHLIRNSIDHGIEDQFERAVQGKTSLGNLSLSILEGTSAYRISYKDDGKGLDKNRILSKALRVGLTTEEKSVDLSESEIFSFIFEPGFSTKEKITTMSGRGVGLDVVHSMIKKYQGKIEVQSLPGQGTEFRIEIPVPKHIMVESAMICSWNSYQFAVPMGSISSITTCADLQVTCVQSSRYCQYKGLTIPLLNYQEIVSGQLSMSTDQVKKSSVVIVRTEDFYLGILIDKVETQTELVLKPFSTLLKMQRGFKGLSILPDERMAYVMDANLMAQILVDLDLSVKVAA